MANYNNKPRPVWQDDINKSFINPYNFLPTAASVTRSTPESGTLSGKIRCRIVAVTPLAVPDAEKRKEDKDVKDHYIYPFFSVYDGKHIIPGSSLRGVVRSMFEAVTNSCYSVNNNNILSARHSHPRLPGILVKKDGKWILYSASYAKCKENDEPKENQVKRIWYDKDRRKNTYSMFTIGNIVCCSELEKAVDNYRECIEIYRKNAEDDSKSKLFEKTTHTLDENGMTPVFYELVEYGKGKKIVYLSPSQISRSVFHNKLNDLLGDNASCRLKNGNELCEACSLFGIIRNEEASYASKVRFGDAEEIKFISGGYHTLKELSSPKTTSVEFYTERPSEAVAWNYDYMTTNYLDKKDPNGRNVKVPQRRLTQINVRGRKFYLHTEQRSYETKEKTKRNNTSELAEKGSEFRFDVYFDSVTEDQLRKLVWVLSLGENKTDSKRLYKIGHGKPLGLGSVKIVVENVTVRNYDNDSMKYSLNELDANELIDNCELKMNDALSAIVNLDTTEGKNVSYPIAEDKTKSNKNSAAAHQWFAANRTINGTGVAWNVKYTLPHITDDKITLPAYERVIGGSSDRKPPEQRLFGDSFGGGSIQIKRRGEKRDPTENKSNRKKKGGKKRR